MEQSKLLSRLRVNAKNRGVDFRILFEDIDRRSTGTVSLNQARQIIGTAGVPLDENTYSALCGKYEREGRFVYENFLEDIEISNEEICVDPQLLKKFASSLVIRGTDVVECCRRYDRFNNGKVSASSFLTAVGRVPYAEEVARAFSNSEGEIPYYTLNEQIRKAQATKEERVEEITEYELPSFFPEVATIIKFKGYDLVSAFRREDRDKTSRVSPNVFARILVDCNTRMSPKQIEELTNTFRTRQGCDYKAFINEINKFKPQSTRRQTEERTIRKKEPEEILQFVENEIRTRHIRLDELVEPLDRRHTGVVNAQAFGRMLSHTTIPLSADDIQTLVDGYSDGNELNYRQFLGDIEERTKTFTVSQQIPSPVERIKEILMTKRIQIRPLLERRDTDRDGKIYFDQFINCLRHIGINVEPDEIAVLRNTFEESNTEYISIRDVCDTLDPVLEINNFEQEEIKKTTHIKREPTEDVCQVLSQIAENSAEISNDIQRYRASRISTRAFTTIICRASHDIQQNALRILVEFYGTDDGQEVYAIDFVQDLANAEPVKKEAPNCDDLLYAIKQHFIQNRLLPLPEQMAAIDYTHMGSIPDRELYQILMKNRFQNASEATRLLCNVYRDSRNPNYVNYRRLSLEMGGIESERLDTRNVSIPQRNIEEMSYQTRELVESIAQRLRARRRSVWDAFSDASQGLMDQDEFRQRFMSFGLDYRFTDLQKLFSFYKYNMRGDIDWNRFCTDVSNLSNRTSRI